MNRPLDGVRVLELGQLLAGPFTGCILAYFGAEVIKVETPGKGDPLRGWRVLENGTSLWWRSLGRNKKCITLNLREDDGRAIAVAARKEALEPQVPGLTVDTGHRHGAVVGHIEGFVVVVRVLELPTVLFLTVLAVVPTVLVGVALIAEIVISVVVGAVADLFRLGVGLGRAVIAVAAVLDVARRRLA